MKKLIHKVGLKIHSKKGETLTESLISTLLLTLISLAVVVSVQIAMNITANSLERAREMQEKVNTAVHSASGTSGTITFSDSHGISAQHYVTIYDTDGIIAFDPQT